MALTVATFGNSNSDQNGPSGTHVQWPFPMATALGATYPSQTFTVTKRGVSGTCLRSWLPANKGVSVAGMPAADIDTVKNDNPDVVAFMPGTNDFVISASGDAAAFSADLATLIAYIKTWTAPHNADGVVRVVVLEPPVAAPMVAYNTSGLANPSGSGTSGTGPYLYGRPKTTYTGVTGLVDLAAACAECTADAHVATRALQAAAYGGWDGSSNTTCAGLLDGVHLSVQGQNDLGGWAATAAGSLLASDGTVSLSAWADLQMPSADLKTQADVKMPLVEGSLVQADVKMPLTTPFAPQPPSGKIGAATLLLRRRS